MWTVLLGEVVAAAAVLAWSPKARDAARPYLVRGIRSALDIKDDLSRMVDEAKREAEQIADEIDAGGLGAAPSGSGGRIGAGRRLDDYAEAGARAGR
ncbi:MAG: hypothetical protein ACYDAB_16985 [bacterium]